MSMKKPLIVLTFSAFALPAVAQDGLMLMQADTDGDRSLSAAEVQEAARLRFQNLDGNGDGAVSEKEFVDHSLVFVEMLDTDGDGSVSRGELRDAFISARKSRR